MPVVDPTLEGALIGAGATALGGVIAWHGAKSQARASLKAVELQHMGQRFDALWQMRRDAYAIFIDSVERTRTAIRHAYAVTVVHEERPNNVTVDSPSVAQQALAEAMKEMWHRQSALRLSVSETEAGSAESLVSLVNGLNSDLNNWIVEALSGSAHADELRATFQRRQDSLRGNVGHFIKTARGYLEVTPELDPLSPGLWYRFRAWRLDRSFRSLDR